MASAKIPPRCRAWLQGWWRWDAALGDLVDGGGETLAMAMVPMEQQDAARRDAASGVVGCRMLLSSRASRAPGNVSSAHVSSREGQGRKQWDPFQD